MFLMNVNSKFIQWNSECGHHWFVCRVGGGGKEGGGLSMYVCNDIMTEWHRNSHL